MILPEPQRVLPVYLSPEIMRLVLVPSLGGVR